MNADRVCVRLCGGADGFMAKLVNSSNKTYPWFASSVRSLGHSLLVRAKAVINTSSTHLIISRLIGLNRVDDC